ncbi:unnamed protein product [Strongylus vulgaris]|uniref:Uncharacterized protein n=1 Tax=Strongylus vulgaris TaxID=40348 RepID=A0A3P7IPS8_STRVU|nr:unnamed protein product [Strongylus vulgaris]
MWKDRYTVVTTQKDLVQPLVIAKSRMEEKGGYRGKTARFPDGGQKCAEYGEHQPTLETQRSSDNRFETSR